jgi:hypothetical protein
MQNCFSRHKRKANAALPAWMRRIATVLTAAALCSAAAGCADTGGMTSKSDGSGQMRYYGGPKSPMWSDRQLGERLLLEMKRCPTSMPEVRG